MNSISEFSLFDYQKEKENSKPTKDSNPKNKSTKILFPEFQIYDLNISLNKPKNPTNFSTTNDSKNSNFTNNSDTNNIPLCRKLDFFSQETDEDTNNNIENDMMCIESDDEKKNNSKILELDDEDENEEIENREFNFIRRESSNNFALAKPKFDEDYVIIKTLCNGEMGTVYLCVKFQDKKTYVVKKTKFFSRKFDYYNMKEFCYVIKSNLLDPCSQFIQTYNDFWVEESEENFPKGGNKIMYIVTNYCLYGDLKSYLKLLKENNINCDKYFYWDIIFEMIISVYFLHKLGYVHFDIKPDNFLVKENGELLLSDFCLSIKEKEIIKNSSEDFEGDSIYISPELFYKDKDIINQKTDIFSLGLSILEILTNCELPKNGLQWQLIRTKGVPEIFLQKIPAMEDDNKKFINLITSFTKYRSEDRPELESIIKDKNNYEELYERYQLLIKERYCPRFIPKGLKDIKKESYDFSNNFGDFRKRFIKRSDSMREKNK